MGWIENFANELQALSPGRQIALAGTAVGSLAFFLYLALGMSGPDERLLYGQLPPDEAARIVEALRGDNVSYRLADGGTSVYVPAASVHEARIRLAGQGLPGSGGSGFEIFDKSGFGVSDFVNRVNYQRAIQGELARSIEQIDAVERARVQLAMPERRGFVSSKPAQSTASVVVRVKPGHEITTQQVRGIVHLVASSLQDLPAERVSLVDDRGRLLAPEPGLEGMPNAVGTLSHQDQLEKDLARRIEAILEPTLGDGRVVARVRADLDWTQNEQTEERFDPDSQVARREELMEEEERETVSAGVGAAPGAASNIPGSGGGPPGPGAGSTRKTETISYEINKVVSRTVGETGEVKQLDVAVLVDGKLGGEPGEFLPWDTTELADFEELAKRAVGFSAERGDRITLTSAPFQTLALPEDEGFVLEPEVLLLASSVLRFIGVLVALLLFARMVVSPLVKRLAEAPAPPLPARAGDLELQLAGDAPAGELTGNAIPAQPEALVPGGDEGVKTLKVWLSER